MSDELDDVLELDAEALAFAEEWESMSSMQRRFLDPEYRAKHVERLRKMHADPEFKAKQAEAMRKMHADPEFKAKNAERLRKRNADPEHRAKQAERMRDKYADPEHRAKQAEANRKQSISVVCVELGVVYNGSRDAARLNSIDQSSISQACKGRLKTAGGYHWRYATPEEVERIRNGQDKS